MKCFALVAGALLAGCASKPPAELPAPGPEPTAAQAEKIARDYLARVLKDPDSLKQFALVRGPYRKDYQITRWSPWNSGYIVCFTYNAKNSYGGYVGPKLAAIAIKGAESGPYLLDAIPEAFQHLYC